VTVQLVVPVVEQATVPRMMATYPVMAEPPSEVGGDHDTVAPPWTGAAVTDAGAPGFLTLGVFAPAGAEAAMVRSAPANRAGQTRVATCRPNLRYRREAKFDVRRMMQPRFCPCVSAVSAVESVARRRGQMLVQCFTWKRAGR
jgi:hypothetical protein